MLFNTEIKDETKSLTSAEIRERIVGALFEKGEMTDAQLHQLLNLPMNIITARRNELLLQGRIIASNKVKSEKSNRYVFTWKPLQQIKIFSTAKVSDYRKKRMIKALCKANPENDLAKKILAIFDL